MKNQKYLSIGDVAARTGTSVSALRFYADENLVPFQRSHSGHRIFPQSSIRRISFILISQNLGYSLKEIKEILKSLPQERTPTKADWDRLAQRFSHDIEQRIDALQTLQTKLSGCIGCGCLSLKSCRLYNPDDQARKYGSGPRFLMGNAPEKAP